MIRSRALVRFALVAWLGLGAASCAYYNTFYLARKYYFRASEGKPYLLDRSGASQPQYWTKSIDYSKKVLGQYPRSKWVDDAYLLWARALLGRDDPLKTAEMLKVFDEQFPDSPLKSEAKFWLGVANRQSRRYAGAVTALDTFLAAAPKSALAPYAWYERSRALQSLDRFGESAEAAGRILELWPKHELVARARLQRAEARFQQRDFAGARADFRDIGRLALNDEERFTYLLRESDCLEAARDYDGALALLADELGRTPPPAPVPTGQLPPPGADRYGRLTLRLGTVHLLAGRSQDALQRYENVKKDYPKSALSAEAQYRIGYAYETAADDFTRATEEYAKVKEEFGAGVYAQQALTRQQNLERIAQYRSSAGADSLERKAEAEFLRAELYLFQLERPERAIEVYQEIVRDFPGTDMAGRALNAQAWVLSRKLRREAAADSLFWRVVREFPATEAQLAARDYLESAGQTVDERLIVPPKPKVVVAPVDTVALPKPPAATPTLGLRPPGSASGLTLEDSLAFRRDPRMRMLLMPDSLRARYGLTGSRDSLPGGTFPLAPPDTARREH